MSLERLFHSVVLGAGLAATGCTPGTVEPKPLAAPLPPSLLPDSPLPPSSEQASPVPSAPADSTSAAPPEQARPPATEDCSKVCAIEDGALICPDERNAMGCCWLMVINPHPCCNRPWPPGSPEGA